MTVEPRRTARGVGARSGGDPSDVRGALYALYDCCMHLALRRASYYDNLWLYTI